MSSERPKTTPGDRHARPLIRYASVAMLGIAVAAGCAVTSRGKETAPDTVTPAAVTAASSAVEVGVERLSRQAVETPVRLTGFVRTDEVITLSTKATGLLERVLAKEGDRVKRGQLLAEIDSKDLKAQLDRARAAVIAAEAQVKEAEAAERAAEARLQQAKTGSGIKNTAAETEHRRAVDNLAAAKSRLEQAKSLAGIAATEADTRVASARAALQAARERLKVLQDGSRKQETATAEASVNRAKTQVARAKSMLDRREQLFKEKAIAAEVVDNARRDYEAAQADLDAARQQLSLVKEGPRSEEIRAAEEVVRQSEAALRDAEANRARRKVSDEDVLAAEAQVRQAEAGVEAAKANLASREVNEDEIRSAEAALLQARAMVAKARAATNQARADVRYQQEIIAQTRVFSPVNGVITERMAHPGSSVVQTRSELFRVVSDDTLFFEAGVPEASLQHVKQGLPAHVVLDTMPGQVLPGTVREIIPVVEGNNRSVRVRISFQRPANGRAVVGGFARAQLQGQTITPALSVPRSALAPREGELGVYVLEDGRANWRPIKVADTTGIGKRVYLYTGLKEGDTIITSGLASVTDGQEVTVKSEQTPDEGEL